MTSNNFEITFKGVRGSTPTPLSPKQVQEKIVKNVDELLGEGMYDLKAQASGRVAVVMNTMNKINKTLKIAQKIDRNS